jgi:hypothetical protein
MRSRRCDLECKEGLPKCPRIFKTSESQRELLVLGAYGVLGTGITDAAVADPSWRVVTAGGRSSVRGGAITARLSTPRTGFPTRRACSFRAPLE